MHWRRTSRTSLSIRCVLISALLEGSTRQHRSGDIMVTAVLEPSTAHASNVKCLLV